MSLAGILGMSLMFSQPQPVLPDFGKNPTVNLSAIRSITCDDRAGGTGFLVADNVIATALHVVEGRKCFDENSYKPLLVYHVDKAHDFVLAYVEMKGVPYIKYDCSRFVTGKNYGSYGYSSYLQDYTIFRQSNMLAYKDYSGKGFRVGGRELPRLRHMFGPMVFGHSGGPVIDYTTGIAVGMNNAGITTMFGSLVTGHGYSTELADTVLCKY